MNTAQVLFEQYKILPLKIQKELFTLINDGMKASEVQNEFEKRIEKISKLPKRPLEDILADIEKAADQHMKENDITMKDIDKMSAEFNKNRTEFKRKMRNQHESSN